MGELINLIDSGKVSNTLASQKIFPEMIKTGKMPQAIAEEQNHLTESDSGALQGYIIEAIQKYPEKVTEYKNGKTGLLGLFMGEVMKLSKGKADPKVANELLRKTLDEYPLNNN
jgi:aspartyl-tRNA(Asn)/glutamyl-tRNA(Gln) amidotransferase subunit B